MSQPSDSNEPNGLVRNLKNELTRAASALVRRGLDELAKLPSPPLPVVSELAAFIFRVSVDTASSVEEGVKKASGTAVLSHGDFQTIVEETAILLLHCVGCEAYEQFDGSQHGLDFLNAVYTAVSDYGCQHAMTANHPVAPFVQESKGTTVAGLNRDLCHIRVAEYSRYELFPAEDVPSEGTLWEEFGAHVKAIGDKYGPGTGAISQVQAWLCTKDVWLDIWIEVGRHVAQAAQAHSSSSDDPSHLTASDEYVSETYKALLMYCRENGRVCPQPQKWNALYEMLPETRRVGFGFEPAAPLILGAWHDTSVSDKRQRLAEHIEWARDHGCLEAVAKYLFTLQEEDWHHEHPVDAPEPSDEDIPF